MIVVDTNIISYLLFPSEKNEIVEELQLKDGIWVAPPLWQSEFRNVTALFFRKNIITFEDGLEAIGKAEIIMGGFEMQVKSNTVFQLVKESTCSSYDCEFVALAQDLQVPLITYDGEILKTFPSIAQTPEQLLA